MGGPTNSSKAFGAHLLSAVDFVAVTPNDSVDLTDSCLALYVGGAGDITVHDRAGNTVLFTAVPAGSILPIQTKRVMATNTDATGLVALYGKVVPR
jgi:hypothetical protein